MDAREEIPKGYLSPESKRKYSIIVGIIVVVFIFIQILIGFTLGILISLPKFHMNVQYEEALFRDAVMWKEKIWYVHRSTNYKRDPIHMYSLMCYDPDSKSQPEKIIDLPCYASDLLPINDTLWLISQDTVCNYIEEKLTAYDIVDTLGTFSAFVYKNNPSVLEKQNGTYLLKSFQQEEWKTLLSIDLVKSLSSGSTVQILRDKNSLYFFLEFDRTLYYWKGIPQKTTKIWEIWEEVDSNPGNWEVVILDNEPVVFQSSYKGTIKGLRKEEGIWKEFFKFKEADHWNFGIVPLDDDEGYVLMYQNDPQNINFVHVENNEVNSKQQYVIYTPKGLSGNVIQIILLCVIYLMGPLLIVILAIIISILMQKYRITIFSAGVPFASLIQRTFSQFIDFLLLVAPLASGVLFAILEVVRNESFKQPFLTYILLGVSSTIILFVLFTFLEGKFGRTPGKWIFRIQVRGTDLKPCGFGRAFIRNLLKFVDGFFNFMVCIILISLTENWQRVGDMVARTIVIRKPLK